MGLDELKEKALSLPLSPGVYIMKDKDDKVIYVGKAKKLKNRVSQYFQESASHNAKTRIMVSKVDHFDVIVAASEFEALVLECSLIKRHQPKYNILLKDDKGYPYLRLDMREEYPSITMSAKPSDDGAVYFGPYGSRSVTNSALEAMQLALKLPTCNKKFPRDIGKGRPCLHYHMNNCAGWCMPERSKEEYRLIMEQARQLLLGNYKLVYEQIREQMLLAADSLNFELAAGLRDKLNAIESLGQKQLVTAGNMSDLDAIGFAQTETKACFTILHFQNGNLLDKDFDIIHTTDEVSTTVSSLVKQYYWNRGFAPKTILLPIEMEDITLFEQLLQDKFEKKSVIKVPQRGDNFGLIKLAQKNALEEAERVTDREERINATLALLGKTLSIPVPNRIEAYDISNISGTDIVGSMVVFEKGKPKRSAYKRFKIEDLTDQNDYASMAQVIRRRFSRYMQNDSGFNETPDLLLIDGGEVHANTVCNVLKELNLDFPVYGMVKDDRHRTRALVTADGELIGIDSKQALFSLIGNIQEETHRFAINYHKHLRSKRLKYSQLDNISGIGPKRKEELLKKFKSIKNIADAELYDLEQLLPKDVAFAVYNHFRHPKEG